MILKVFFNETLRKYAVHEYTNGKWERISTNYNLETSAYNLGKSFIKMDIELNEMRNK